MGKIDWHQTTTGGIIPVKWPWRMCVKNQLELQQASCFLIQSEPGGRLNKKDGLTRYGDSHVKDKTS